MTQPIFLITNPRQGDILVYNAELDAWVNVPEAPRLTRLKIYCSAPLLGDGLYHFELGKLYTFTAQLVGVYYPFDLTVNIALLADGDYPLQNQYEPSNLLTSEQISLVIKAATGVAHFDIIFNSTLDLNQASEVYGKLFSTDNLPNEVILYNDDINNVPFVLSADEVNPNLYKRVYYGYSSSLIVPTKEQLDTPDIGGQYAFQNFFMTDPVDNNFSIVCDSPLLQGKDLYYWVILPSSFNLITTVDFDNTITLPYLIEGTSYTAMHKASRATFLNLQA